MLFIIGNSRQVTDLNRKNKNKINKSPRSLKMLPASTIDPLPLQAHPQPTNPAPRSFPCAGGVPTIHVGGVGVVRGRPAPARGTGPPRVWPHGKAGHQVPRFHGRCVCVSCAIGHTDDKDKRVRGPRNCSVTPKHRGIWANETRPVEAAGGAGGGGGLFFLRPWGGIPGRRCGLVAMAKHMANEQSPARTRRDTN